MPYPAHFSRCLLAIGLSTASATGAFADSSDSTNAKANDERRVEAIKPEEQTTRASRAAIDSERFEAGLYGGILSVEDFGTQGVGGFSVNYHFNSHFLAQINYGRSDVERATFEEVSGGDFLAESDRTFEYRSLLGGYRLMEGRSFLGERRKFNSYLYIMAGASQISFAGEDNSGIVVGLTYKTVLTDWLTLNLDFRDIILDREFLDDTKTTHNTELTLGLSALF